MAGPGQDAPPTQRESPPMQAQQPPPQQPPAQQPPAQQPPPQQPSGPQAPSAVSNFVSSLSQAELFIFGGGAAIVLTDIILTWLVRDYSFSHVIVAGGALGLVLVGLRSRLPAAVASNYAALLFVVGAVVGWMGLRNLVIDVLAIMRPPAGAAPLFLVGMIVVAAGAAAMAYGAWMLWRGRST